jgi:Uncharacterized alpha/beta hydrolase domain (DUF2235)
MVSRLILCLDGTWNTADAASITNIVRIRDLIDPAPEVEGGEIEDQRVYYHDGVGTGLSMQDRLFGGMGGYGLDHNVRAAYRFISAHYKPSLEIYIFGFSRGAFTARSLMGYLSAPGLLRAEHCSRENEARAWRYYRTPPDERFPQEGGVLADLSHPNVRVRCVGVFDTVGALGVPVHAFSNWNRRRFQFHDVTLGSNVDFAFHALAIDEKRGPFQASLWQYPNHKHFTDVEQVWFPGVHSNIGGGYPDRGLSDRVLQWMMSRIEAKNLGLKFLSGWDKTLSPALMGELYESRTAAYFWSKQRPMVRVINQQRPEHDWRMRLSSLSPNAILLGEAIHVDALLRWKVTADAAEPYRPPNLAAALAKTFTTEDPWPIPIVDQHGAPLDWVDQDKDLKTLKDVLPKEFEAGCNAVVAKWRGKLGSSVFCRPYLQPRIPVSAH